MAIGFRPSNATSLALVVAFFAGPLLGPATLGQTTMSAKETTGTKYTAANASAATKGTADAGPERAVSSSVKAGYRVGAADDLMVSVWHEPELSQAVTVRSDGMITLPLLNDVKVAGLTTEEMQELLTEKLKTLVNDPQVTVIVKAVHSQKVYAVGSVAKQGAYPLDGRKTALELIVEAGGLGPFAKSGSIYVLRNENGKQIRIPFNYKKAVSGKGPNPELIPGDMVVVP